MKRIDYIRAMSAEEMAEIIIENSITDTFCESDCVQQDDCLHEKECCVQWLNEEMEETNER